MRPSRGKADPVLVAARLAELLPARPPDAAPSPFDVYRDRWAQFAGLPDDPLAHPEVLDDAAITAALLAATEQLGFDFTTAAGDDEFVRDEAGRFAPKGGGGGGPGEAPVPDIAVEQPEVTSGIPPGMDRVADRLDPGAGRSRVKESMRVGIDAVTQLHGVRPDALTPELTQFSSIRAGGHYRWETSIRDGQIVRGEIGLSGNHPNNREGAGAFNMTHEVGHWLDQQSMGDSDRSFASAAGGSAPVVMPDGSVTRERQYPDDTPAHWRSFFDAVDQSGVWEKLAGSNAGVQERVYLRNNAEVFARAYSQYVATTDDRVYDSMLAWQWSDQTAVGAQWDPDAFGPVADAVEGVLRGEGLMS